MPSDAQGKNRLARQLHLELSSVLSFLHYTTHNSDLLIKLTSRVRSLTVDRVHLSHPDTPIIDAPRRTSRQQRTTCANTCSTRKCRYDLPAVSPLSPVTISCLIHRLPLLTLMGLRLKSLIILTGKKWFDCAECHAEQEIHPLLQTLDMTFICKKCRKAFRKNIPEFEEAYVYLATLPVYLTLPYPFPMTL